MTRSRVVRAKIMDLRQSSQYTNYLRLMGWIVEKVDGCYIFIRKIPLTPFSIIKVQRPQKIPFKKINQLAKKRRAFAIYFEPNLELRITNHELRKRGYRLSKSPFLPTKSVQIDLSLSKEKILAQMKKDARYSIRKAEKMADKPTSCQADKDFHQAWKKSVSWQRYVLSLKSLATLKKAFGQNAIFLATIHHTPYAKLLAGTVILIANKSAYYYYAFSSKEGRKKSAQYLLVWEAIKEAKKRGCKIFDFEGIYDERFPVKSWKGFSHFKRSFGGKKIQYPGCFVKYRFPF